MREDDQTEGKRLERRWSEAGLLRFLVTFLLHPKKFGGSADQLSQPSLGPRMNSLRRSSILLLSFLLLTAHSVLSQDTTKTLEEGDKTAEDLLENSSQDTEDSQLLDELTRLQEHPLDLNAVSSEELQVIPGVTPFIAQSIVNYRERIGRFSSVAVLSAVDGMTRKLYSHLRKYVCVDGSTQRIGFTMRSRAIRDLQERKGFQDGTYSNSPFKSYNRFVAEYSAKVEAGLLFEKDAGEQRLNDFTAGYVELKDLAFVSEAVLGDYILEVGQGIALWRSNGFSKGSEVVYPVKKIGRTVQPYLSSDENKFLRGGAATVRFSEFEATAFYSNNRLDASFDTLGGIKSFDISGLHRTQSELDRQDAAREILFGGRIGFHKANIRQLGLTYYVSSFDKDVAAGRLFQFQGRDNNMLSLDYDVNFKNVNVFGEWARSYTGAVGGITGVLVRFDPVHGSSLDGANGDPGRTIVDMALVVRNYPKDFISLHGFGFGENNGDTQNEFGIYTGVKIRATQFVEISAYYDQFKFPWQTYFNPLPTSGNDALVQTVFTIQRGLEVTIRYKNESKEDVQGTLDDLGREVKRLTDRTQQNFRVGVSFDVSERVRLRGRAELVDVQYDLYGQNGKGYLLYQDVRVNPTESLTLDGRLVFFDTDSYDTRLYEYESDIRGVSYNPGLYGKGRRLYLVAHYKVLGFLELSAKYAQTFLDGVKVVGSGEDTIRGDIASRISLQMEFKW